MNAVDALVGRNIRKRRNVLGMSQTELGQTVNVSFQQVQKYESGATRVSASSLWCFARALSVPVEYFFEGADLASDGKCPNSVATGNFHIDKESVLLVKHFQQLPPPKRTALLSFVQAISGRTNQNAE